MATPTREVLVYRHTVATRLTHWVNVLALLLLLMSGLQIFNAHPALYWGQKSTFAQPWLEMGMIDRGDHAIGVTQIGSVRVETTGLFGYSGKVGSQEPRGFPAWATIPSYRDLADGRHWHFFFAWVFVLNGLTYWSAGLLNGHFRKDLAPTREQLTPRHLLREIADHARLRFPKGEEERHYNALQKLAYLAVIFGLLPLMVLTGLTMSPGMDAAWPWLPHLFGGRQSARSIHFICAGLIVAFVLVHLAMVVAVGAFNSVRSMITGRYAIRLEGDAS
ncbi:cytochrome b/b6 domain-containing protein [Phenylobacterium aquaticum]|uniref:cytochrome b/b6 domain-containing protein n=1 Tax=Phenylobacterium aquaticum TaxID=1763816 RepID=UPI001F5DF68A|nr:cytochrome b/b6 domain-containing protein [Phenylobacterium aquaticum]MCI3135643.1 cytochrome b/b6 domain-containing protein [Phenylobacterium aquaticum]